MDNGLDYVIKTRTGVLRDRQPQLRAYQHGIEAWWRGWDRGEDGSIRRGAIIDPLRVYAAEYRYWWEQGWDDAASADQEGR